MYNKSYKVTILGNDNKSKYRELIKVMLDKYSKGHRLNENKIKTIGSTI